jgi:hypothetical protein
LVAARKRKALNQLLRLFNSGHQLVIVDYDPRQTAAPKIGMKQHRNNGLDFVSGISGVPERMTYTLNGGRVIR